MPRSSIVAAYALKSRILELRSQSPQPGYGSIAASLGVSRAYVQQVCKSGLDSPVNPRDVQDRAIALKRDFPKDGSVQILGRLSEEFPSSVLPSQATLERWFKAEKLVNKRLSFSTGSRSYWHEDRPTKHGQRWEIDTVKLNLGGKTVECIAVIDWYSRLVWAEPMRDKSFAAFLPWFLKRAFDVLGIPNTIQVDNGFGFILPKRNILSRFLRYAFSRGVSTVEFIPVAEAQRNGRIESFNRWFKEYYANHSGDTLLTFEGLQIFVNDALKHYNTKKPHLGISERKKGGYRVPAALGTYNHLPAVTPRVIDVPARVERGTVAYKRLVYENGEAVINAPATLVMLSPGLYGHYVTIEMPIGAPGRVLWPHLVDRKPVVDVVGTFDHDLGGVVTDGLIDVDMVPGFAFDPIPFDIKRKMMSDAKHLKQAYKPGYLPSGFELVSSDDGSWVIRDSYGEVVYSDQCYQVEHAREVLPVV